NKEQEVAEVPYTENTIHHSIRVFGKDDFFFGLDQPLVLSYQGKHFKLDGNLSHRQKRWKWVPRYKVISGIDKKLVNDEATAMYLKVFLPRKEKEWIQQTFQSENISDLQKEIGNYFLEKGFVYTLAPGRVPNFLSFMLEKRSGFCSHYAS